MMAGDLGAGMEDGPEETIPPFPPSPPGEGGEGGSEVGEPGVAILVDAIRDPQFWKDCPVEKGCVLELPFLRRNGNEDEKGLVCIYVSDVCREESGLYLGVKLLGADAHWCRLEGVKMFSRQRRRVHVCKHGPLSCEDNHPKLWHIQEFAVFPPGSHPPKYVEKVKLKEWRKLYAATLEERGRGGLGKGEGAPERRDEGAPDRVAALRKRLQMRQHGPPAGAGLDAVSPPGRTALTAPGAVATASHRQVAAIEDTAEERAPEPERGDRRRAREPSMKSALADAVAQRNQGRSRTRSPRRRRRDSRSPSRKKKKKKKKGRRRRDSRDSRSGSSEESSSSSSLLPPLQKKAARHPGSVLKMLLESVGEALADAAVRKGDTSPLLDRTSKMMSYFQIVAKPHLPGKVRDLRELETLGRCIDLLAQGALPELGDALAGRFLAVESAGLTNNWQDAQHLEVIPVRHAGLAPPAVMLRAQKHTRTIEKATGQRTWSRWGGSWAPRETPGAKADEKGGAKGKGEGAGRGKGGRKGKSPWRSPRAKGGGKDAPKEGEGAAAPSGAK